MVVVVVASWVGGFSDSLSARPVRATDEGKEQTARARDVEIVMELHHDNRNVMAWGRMAQSKAASPQVKELGATMTREHAITDEKLVAYARRNQMGEDRLKTPYDASVHGELKFNRLRRLQGREFDREFTHMTVIEHQKIIDRVTESHRIAGDPALRPVLEQHLVALEKHQAIARTLADRDSRPVSNQAQH